MTDIQKKKRNVDPDKFIDFIKTKITDNQMYYLLLDEVQILGAFESVLNGYLRNDNMDVFVTGSNAKLLQRLFDETYIRDIEQRYKIRSESELEELLNVLSSSIGSLTNPEKLCNTFRSVKKSKITAATLKKYLDVLKDSFLVDSVNRYDIKGKSYIASLKKYYFANLVLRIEDSFKKIIVTHEMIPKFYNEEGVLTVNIYEFLLDESIFNVIIPERRSRQSGEVRATSPA